MKRVILREQALLHQGLQFRGLMVAVEVGSQRVVGEMLLPKPRRQEMGIFGRVVFDALQDIDEIRVGVDIL